MTRTPFLSRSRRLATILLAGGLVVALAACSGGGTGTTPSLSDSAEGVDDGSTLTLWTRAPLEKQANLLVDAYNATHKNQVDLTVVPGEDYVAKVGAAAGAKQLPDLFAADIVFVPNWTKQGLFADLTSKIDALPYKDKINKGHLDAGTTDGKKYVLPFVLDLSMTFWNKDIYERAGLDPDKGPATMQEYAANAKTIQEKLGNEGISGTATAFGCGGCLLFTWFPSIWAGGAEIMNPEGTEATLDSSTTKGVLSAWADMWKSGAVLPSSEQEQGPTWTAGFTQGKVGQMLYPATLLSSTPFDVGVAGIPGPDGGESTFVGGDGIGISADSKKADQAWNFLNWLMSEDAQVGVLAKDNDVVSRSDFASNEYSEKDPRLVTINEVAAKGKTPISLNFNDAFIAAGNPWVDLIRNAVINGDSSSLAEDNEKITEILSK
jgi:multiple sugar transport system substrate-binding protein